MLTGLLNKQCNIPVQISLRWTLWMLSSKPYLHSLWVKPVKSISYNKVDSMLLYINILEIINILNIVLFVEYISNFSAFIVIQKV